MKKRLFISSDSENGILCLVIEEDKFSIWAYVFDMQANKISNSCFLFSKIKPLAKLDYTKLDKNNPSPLTLEFANELSIIEKVDEKYFEIAWQVNNDSVLIYFKSQLICYLEIGEKRGYTKTLNKDGIYGNKWKNNIEEIDRFQING